MPSVVEVDSGGAVAFGGAVVDGVVVDVVVVDVVDVDVVVEVSAGFAAGGSVVVVVVSIGPRSTGSSLAFGSYTGGAPSPADTESPSDAVRAREAKSGAACDVDDGHAGSPCIEEFPLSVFNVNVRVRFEFGPITVKPGEVVANRQRTDALVPCPQVTLIPTETVTDPPRFSHSVFGLPTDTEFAVVQPSPPDPVSGMSIQ